MKCPSCKQGSLENAYLDELFPCKTCNYCQGNWILLSNYLSWKESYNDEDLAVQTDVARDASESKRALICPETGTLMLKYRMSKDSFHRLDLSPAANAIWLDKGEWELLKSEGIAHKLNSIFTEPWQNKIKSEAAADIFDALYREKFGEEDYTRIKEIRQWLLEHPKSKDLKAFLLAQNPWSAAK